MKETPEAPKYSVEALNRALLVGDVFAHVFLNGSNEVVVGDGTDTTPLPLKAVVQAVSKAERFIALHPVEEQSDVCGCMVKAVRVAENCGLKYGSYGIFSANQTLLSSLKYEILTGFLAGGKKGKEIAIAEKLGAELVIVYGGSYPEDRQMMRFSEQAEKLSIAVAANIQNNYVRARLVRFGINVIANNPELAQLALMTGR